MDRGRDDIETLDAQGQLANAYANLGRYRESEVLFREALDAQRAELGEAHPLRLATLNNLSNLYMSQERYEEATKLFREILDIRLRELGEDHPLTLMSLNNLASTYGELGRYQDALPLIERAVRIAERVWGPEHPSYGVMVHTLGELKYVTDRLAEAESHFRHALTIYQLQPAHEFTGLVLYQLAQVSARQKKSTEALDFLTRALDAGYVHEGSPVGFAEDPALSSLTGHPAFEAIVAAARARADR